MHVIKQDLNELNVRISERKAIGILREEFFDRGESTLRGDAAEGAVAMSARKSLAGGTGHADGFNEEDRSFK